MSQNVIRSAWKVAAVAMVVTGAFCGQARAVNTVLSQWTFEINTPADVTDSAVGPAVADEVGSGSMQGVHASAASDWSTPVGNGSGNSYSVNNWAIGDYFEFQTSTTGMTDIGLNFTSTSSGTGPKDFKIEYSTDGSMFLDTGVTYINLVTASPISWSSNADFYHPGHDKWVDLTSLSALDNQATLFFRLVQNSADTAGGGAPATGGTSRIDNVTILADYVPQIYGDYNDDKTVDAGDYVTWLKSFEAATPLLNEVPQAAPGTTDVFDYNDWREAFGNTFLVPAPGSGAGLVSGGAVPEPASAALLVIGLAAFCSRRRSV